MLKGKTESGFAFEIADNRLGNIELIDELAAADSGNLLAVSRALTMLLGAEQKKALYDHVRTEDGLVPTEKVMAELTQIMTSGQNAKN